MDDLTPYNLNLRHLAAVAAVKVAGSISGAARLVHLTQPAISQGIAKLESQLGHPLFVRQPGGMEATEAGKIVGRRAEEALRLIGSRRATNTQIHAFLAFAQAGTYAAAARNTKLSQASLHRAISDLSLALGARLLDRQGRALVLTRRGKEAARDLALGVSEIQSALFELEALAGIETGRIAIGAMPLSRARILPRAINAFHRRFPQVDLVITEGSYAELIEPVRNGRIDIMVGALRDEEMPDLETTPLFDDRPAIIARNGHPLRNKAGSLSASDLLSYPWLISSPGTPLHSLWRTMFMAMDAVPPRVSIECGSAMTIRQLLLSSDHLTLLSTDQVALEIDAGWLANLGYAPGKLSRSIGVTVRRDWRPTPVQAEFLKQLRESADEK